MRFIVRLALVALTFHAAQAAAQQAAAQQEVAFAERGPQFLIAANRSPERIEATRMPLLRQRISLDLREVSMHDAITAISKRSGLRLMFDDNILSGNRTVTLRAEAITVAAALTEVLLDASVDVLFSTSGNAALIRRGAFRSVATGVITGQVTDSTGQGIPGATVSVEGSRITAVTAMDGRFALRGVPVGSQTVAVRKLGYRTQSRRVTVAENAETTVNFDLVRVPTTLTDVVVTQTGEQRRLELGHVVGRINAEAIVKEAPVSSVSELLTGRVTGVRVSQSQGTVGGDVQVQVRTVNSLLLGTQPIVIVDGVRYTSSAFLDAAGRMRDGAFAVFPAKTNAALVEPTSPLNDLNPNDIETIEVVKGSSAATLYGTDASNGVIVVTTKRGRPGPARWNVYARAGLTEIPKFRSLTRYFSWGTQPDGSLYPDNCPPLYEEFNICRQDSITVIRSGFGDPALTIQAAKPRWQYGLNVSGGRPALRYYVAADVEQAIGPLAMPRAYIDSLELLRGSKLPAAQLKPNEFSKINLRSNVSSSLGENLRLDANIGLVRRSNRTIAMDNPYSASNNTTPLAPYGFPGDPAMVFSRTSTEQADRFLLGARGEWRATPWLSARAAIGMDLANLARHSLQRRGEGARDASDPAAGEVQDDRTEQRTTSADAGVTATFRRGRFSARSAVGAQYVRSLNDASLSWGQDLLPGGESVSQAATRSADRLFSETVTVGSYIEETLGLNERLYLTGALRQDGASGFGQEYRAATYPKMSISWLLSEEPFIPHVPGVNEIRLRYAYGAAGQQARPEMARPGFFGRSALIEGKRVVGINVYSLGNPDLRPERIQEHEFGFDGAAIQSRVRTEVTWYRRRTVGQIVQQNLPPGLGSTYTNVGLTTARGFEAALDIRLLEARMVSWDVSVRHSSHSSMLADIGDATEQAWIWGGYKEGYPLGARFSHTLIGYTDANGDGRITSDEITLSDSLVYMGQNTPTRTQTLTTTVGLFNRRLRLSALLDRGTGFTQVVQNTCTGMYCLALLDKSSSLADQAEGWRRFQSTNNSPVEKGDFVRLREVAATIDLPARMLNMARLRTGSLSISARNPKLWTSFPGADPESSFMTGATSREAPASDNMPQSRSWMLRFDLGI